MNPTDWQPIDSAPENVVVLTIIKDVFGVRNQQPLKRSGRLWFYPDGSRSIYYTPTHWRPMPVLSELVGAADRKESA